MRKIIGYLTLILLLFGTIAWYFSDIVTYFVIALIVSAILRTPTNYLNNLHFGNLSLPRSIAILISFGFLISIISLFVLLFVPLISEQVEVLSSLNYEMLLNKITIPIETIENFVLTHGLMKGEKGFLLNEIGNYGLSLFSDFKIGNLLNNILSITGNFFVGILAVSFISFFLLYARSSWWLFPISFIPNAYFEMSINAMYKIDRLLSNYLVGLLLQMIAIFSIVSLGLLLAGVKYALTIGVFAALANLIPYVGPILGASFGLLVGLSTTDFSAGDNSLLLVTVKVAIVFGIVQLTDNILLQPIIFSRSVKAHPLEIFIVVFMGAALAGALGMIAAIPVYTILRVSGLEFWRSYRGYRIFKAQ
jgi:predicted PurR-regulated permease PerM